MSAPLFYANPVPLNPQLHRRFKIKGAYDNFSFARETNSVVLAGAEFREACKYYLIAFAKVSGKAAFPIALLGYRDKENLFLDASGKWRCGYVPAYIRRYPFILARTGAGPDFTVCVDESYAALAADEGQSLFSESGEQTDQLKSILAFVREYQIQTERTDRFLQTLRELELLKDFTARVRGPGGASFSMPGLMVVNESKLQTLPDAQVLRLFRSGELAWVYDHLASISNLNRMPHSAPTTGDSNVETSSPAPKSLIKDLTSVPRKAAPASRKTQRRAIKPAKK